MDKDIKKIKALLTCFNRREKTLACLTQLYRQDGLGSKFLIETYLVDDGSTDHTSNAVAEQFPAVKIIKGSGDLYWNRGMHLAWKTAASEGTPDYFLWLNDDTILYDYAILEMIKCSEIIGGPNLVCGAIRSNDQSKFTYGGLDLKSSPVVPNGEIQTCSVINGNSVLVNEACYNANGNLDPIFPHAIGDHDYGLRVRENGGAVLTTTRFVGCCERNEKLPSWCYSDTPLKARYRSLYSPLGNSNPKYFFIYEKRHFGLLTAFKHYLSIHLRATIPTLWK